MATPLRCAIYTRKSSEEGLEQGFNSLHAQREACEAYVLSQAGEGWSALKTTYDDGGFSGGSMERPGLQALLGDIGRGLIDVVVVYKVDRLTRSLTDFARIVETFDRQGVSFVSVTQAFNTTTSMGRLTLNVLLSFAQFEREVTGERIRDKIAASKAKGMWMGGRPPLGYDLPTDPTSRALVVNPTESEVVRLVFRKYLELGSVHRLRLWLDEQKIRSKIVTTAKGGLTGGLPIDRGAVFYMLRNPIYRGMIAHKDKVYPGLHPAIIDEDLFNHVQESLLAKVVRHRDRITKVSTMRLKGLIFDADGDPMSPTFCQRKGGKVHRYYVSSSLQRGTRRDPLDVGIRRVPGQTIETLVGDCLARLLGGLGGDPWTPLTRVEVHRSTVQVIVRRHGFFRRPSDAEAELQTLVGRLAQGERINHDLLDPTLARVTLPCRLKLCGGKVWITAENGQVTARTKPDPTLIRGLQTAHRHIAKCGGIPIGRLEDLTLPSAPTTPYERNISRLAFLAPDIQTLILEGRHPPGLTLASLLQQDIPPLWGDQRRVFGIPC